MKNFIERMEHFIIRLVIIGLVLMVGVQAIMTQDQYRMFLSWGERLEGEALNYPVNTVREPSSPVVGTDVKSSRVQIVLALGKYSSLPRAVAIINHDQKFSFDRRELNLNLKAGDVVEIDCREYNFPVQFRVEDISANAAFPRKGQTWTTNQGILMIGKVVVK